jgi:hypothetical protein
VTFHAQSRMTKETATELQRRYLRAIEALSESLLVSQRLLSGDEYEAGRKATASIIGRIQIDLLDPLHHPELDDLADSTRNK